MRQVGLCCTFRDGARNGIIQANDPNSSGDPPLKTNSLLATQLLLLPADMLVEEVVLDQNRLLLELSSTHMTAASRSCSCMSAWQLHVLCFQDILTIGTTRSMMLDIKGQSKGSQKVPRFGVKAQEKPIHEPESTLLL